MASRLSEGAAVDRTRSRTTGGAVAAGLEGFKREETPIGCATRLTRSTERGERTATAAEGGRAARVATRCERALVPSGRPNPATWDIDEITRRVAEYRELSGVRELPQDETATYVHPAERRDGYNAG